MRFRVALLEVYRASFFSFFQLERGIDASVALSSRLKGEGVRAQCCGVDDITVELCSRATATVFCLFSGFDQAHGTPIRDNRFLSFRQNGWRFFSAKDG